MTNQPTNTTRKSLFFILCFAFASLLFACDKPQADKTAKPAAQAATSATQAENTASGGMPNITDEDMGNLVRAMHGAVSQQPDDAPKDKYGQPYIIGNLGGVPVNLPSSVVRLVEYDDSPPVGILKNCAPTTHRRAAINPSLLLSVFIFLTVMRNC